MKRLREEAEGEKKEGEEVEVDYFSFLLAHSRLFLSLSLSLSLSLFLSFSLSRFNEWYSAEEASSGSGSLLQFPVGGASAVAKALAASVERRGGVVTTRARVESLVLSDDGKGRAVGVRLAGTGEVVRASRAVVSNADVAGTLALARAAEGGSSGSSGSGSSGSGSGGGSGGGSGSGGGTSSSSSSSSSSSAAASSMLSEALSAQERRTPLLLSFVHLHAGFDAAGGAASGIGGTESGEEEVGMHHLRVESWGGGGGGGRGIDAEQNVSLVSIASVADPALAPPGKHTLHAYYPATEPYEPWEELLRQIERDGGMSKGNNRAKYEEFKEFRAAKLIAAAEEAVPGLRERSEIFLIGGPLTHERYLNRAKGSYGPAWVAGKGFPSAKGPAKGKDNIPPGLFFVGDFVFPGVGVPAVAASGATAASSIVSAGEHWRLLNELGL